MAQLDWERCTREACKLGCFLGSSVEARFLFSYRRYHDQQLTINSGPTPNGPSPSPNDDPSPGPTPNDPEPTPGPTPSGPTPSPGPRSCTEDGIVCMKDDQKQVKECILNQGNIKQVRPPNPNSKSRQIQCCGVEECMEEYNPPTPGPTPSNGPSPSNVPTPSDGPTPSDEPTPSNGPSQDQVKILIHRVQVVEKILIHRVQVVEKILDHLVQVVEKILNHLVQVALHQVMDLHRVMNLRHLMAQVRTK